MNDKIRRSALLVAASDSVVKDNSHPLDPRPPESATFEFPLYLNTYVETDYGYGDYDLKRDADDIHTSLLKWIDSVGKRIGNTGIMYIPEEILESNPIYIDGYRVVEWSYGMMGDNMTLQDYPGDIYECHTIDEYIHLYIYI